MGAEGETELDTLSVLFTDLVGSTELRARLGEDAAEVVRRAHDDLIAQAVAGHGGRVVKGLGDGFLATFGSSARAVNAAVAIQQGFDRLRLDEVEGRLSVRIGLSAGDVTLEDGDVFGTPVIEAARLCGAADGDQILASSVISLLGGGRAGHALTELGDLELKGLAEPVSTLEVVWERAVSVDGRVPLPPTLEIRDRSVPVPGRDELSAALASTWAQVRKRSEPACVLLAGEPGVGKTRLASEFGRMAHEDGSLVLFGRCDEDLGIAYQPFVEALRHHVTHLSGAEVGALGERPEELTRLDPALSRRFPDLTGAPSTGDAAADQFRLFEAVDAWLGAAARASTGGVVLLLDDIHWAAKPTLLLLRHLITVASAAPVMVVATYRDTDLDRTHPLAALLADLRRVDGVERLALGGLTQVGVEELMEAASQQTLDEEGRALAAAIHTESEGNPFFVVELLRHLTESGAIVFDGERWVGPSSVADLAIPDGIREVVGRRLSRLSAGANEVLSWAAVMGRDLRLDVLARVAGGELPVLDVLDEAVNARLVDEVGIGRWRFGHALVQSTLLAELRTTRRVRMHLEVGEAIEAVAPDEVEELALHFSEASALGAGVGSKAVAYLVAAGERAGEGLAFDQAADRYGQAIELIGDLELDVPVERADALCGIARARRWTGEDFWPAVDDALGAAAELGDADRLSRVILDTGRGYAAATFVVDEPRVDRIERCIDLLPVEADRERGLLLCQLTQELIFSNDLPRLLRLEAEVADVVQRLGVSPDGAEVSAAWLVGALNVHQYVGYPADLPKLAADLGAIQGIDSDAGRVAPIAVANVAFNLGDREGLEHAIERLGADGGHFAVPFFIATRRCIESAYLTRYGSVNEAEPIADEVLAMLGGYGEPDAYLFWVNLMSFTRRQQGRHQEALDVGLALMGDDYAGFLPAAARFAIAGVNVMNLCESDRHDDALAVAGPFLDDLAGYPGDGTWLPVMGTFALAAAELGHPSRPWLRERLAPFSDRWSCWDGVSSVAPVTTLLGRLDASLGDFDGAEAWLGRSIDHCRETGATWFLADALLYVGLARLDAGSTEPAAPLLREALDLARAGGYATIERRARQALDQL